MRGAVPPLLQYVLLARCSVNKKHREILITLLLTLLKFLVTLLLLNPYIFQIPFP